MLSKILQDVQTKLEYSRTYSDIVKARIVNYRQYYSDTNNKTLKSSNYRSKSIKKEFSKIIPSITEPVLSNDKLFSSTGYDDSDKSIQLLNYQWNYFLDKNRIVNEAVNNFVIDGTAIIKSEWKLVTEIKKKKSLIYSSNRNTVLEVAASKTKVQAKKILDEFNITGKAPVGIREEDEEIVLENRPAIKVVNPLNVIIDPKAKNIKDARFVIETYELTYKDILNNYRMYISPLDVIREAFSQASEYSAYDAEQFATINQNGNIENMINAFIGEYNTVAEKKVLAYEYWGEISEDNITTKQKVVTWIGSTIIRYTDNPFSHNTHPYSSGSYTYSNDSIFGESDSELIVDDQTGLSRVMRVLDNASIKAENQQEFIEEGFLPDITQQQNYKKGNTVFFKRGSDPRSAIYKNSVEALPDNVSFLKDVYDRQISDSVGITPDYVNNNNNVEDPVNDKEMSKLRSFLEILSDVGSKIVSMNKQFIYEETIINKPTGEKTSILPDELVYKDGITVAITKSRRQRRLDEERLMRLMSTQSANMSPKVAALHYLELAEMFGKYSLASKIEKNIQDMDKPNPANELELERLKLENNKIQLEMKKLEADSNQLNAKAEENIAKAVERYFAVSKNVSGTEAELNKARGNLANAQVSKFNAQTELFNQEFNLIDSGTKQANEDAKLEFQHQANLEREKVRTDRELELNNKAHQQALEQASKEPKQDTSTNPLLEYIKAGTLNNSSYDTADDVYRNILNKNSLDTSNYTNQKGNKDANNE